MHPNFVLVHVKPTLENWLIENGFNWSYSKQHGYDEIDVVIDDIPYECLDGSYQDPDEQLCEHYGLNYDQVNCIEAVY